MSSLWHTSVGVTQQMCCTERVYRLSFHLSWYVLAQKPRGRNLTPQGIFIVWCMIISGSLRGVRLFYWPERDEITRASTLDCWSIRVRVAFWLFCYGYGVLPLMDGYFVLMHTDCSALTEHFLKYVLLCSDLENDEKFWQSRANHRDIAHPALILWRHCQMPAVCQRITCTVSVSPRFQMERCRFLVLSFLLCCCEYICIYMHMYVWDNIHQIQARKSTSGHSTFTC